MHHPIKYFKEGVAPPVFEVLLEKVRHRFFYALGFLCNHTSMMKNGDGRIVNNFATGRTESPAQLLFFLVQKELLIKTAKPIKILSRERNSFAIN